MTIVQELYEKNVDISDLELAEEILKYKELQPLDLWILPQYPFDVWRRKYDYPNLIASIKRRRPDFIEWMNDQGITDDYLLNGYLSDFFENKALDTDCHKHLIRVTCEGKVYLQSWHKYDFNKQYGGGDDPVQYEYIKAYKSYYDWLWENKGIRFSFINDLDRFYPNTDNEIVYVNTDVRMLKMGAMEPPTNVLGMMLRGKMLEFINASGLLLHGSILFGEMGNLEFKHSTVDNLKCQELDIPRLTFANCSVRNIQIRNSDLRGWLFVSSYLTGNVVDSKLSYFRIFGGGFNPTLTNSEITDFAIDVTKALPVSDFEKTYRTLAKAALEAGNNKLAADLKIRELDFIRAKKKGGEKLLMTLNKAYWGYGQRPFQLIKISVVVILTLGLFYSFFPQNFSSYKVASDECYFITLFNSLYFSLVTFTTLGYGDLSPVGFLRIFAGLEALFGAITLGFLVAGLTKNS